MKSYHQGNPIIDTSFFFHIRNALLLTVASVMILSCCTEENILKNDSLSVFSLMAKVFNGENRSCPGVLVTLTNGQGKAFKAQTDITGKALFPPLPFDSYTVIMSKDDYELVTFLFDYNSPDQALYGRLYSFEHLLRQCDHYMVRREWIQAQSYLDRAILIKGDEQLTLFYGVIILWKTGFPREAAAKLENYIKRGPSPENLPVEMSQFLTELYTYDLKEGQSDRNK